MIPSSNRNTHIHLYTEHMWSKVHFTPHDTTNIRIRLHISEQRSTIQKTKKTKPPLNKNKLNDSNRNTHRLNVHYERVNNIDLFLRIVYTVKRVSSYFYQMHFI